MRCRRDVLIASPSAYDLWTDDARDTRPDAEDRAGHRGEDRRVRNRECRMRDVDDRQSEAVGGGREHDGAAVSGREMLYTLHMCYWSRL